MQGKTIGERVRSIRKQNQWSMHQLAERIGSTHSYISQLERGQIRPGIDLVTKLADALDVSIDYLVGRAESGSPTPGPKVLSERGADYVVGAAEPEEEPASAPPNSLLAGIQDDLLQIATYDPAALEYIARMVQAIKEKAVGEHGVQQRTEGSKPQET
ncbi:MAG TPA: helix-turn-helix domain-containing protein [Chloroflexia bacterium]|jgi:transcriptional regulator with XRE-family HTH domain